MSDKFNEDYYERGLSLGVSGYTNYRWIPELTMPLALIAGGAIGNIIDRLRFGKVVDFLDFDFFDINLFGYQIDRWWTFNIADAVISCSIIFLLIRLIFFHHEKPSESTQ